MARGNLKHWEVFLRLFEWPLLAWVFLKFSWYKFSKKKFIIWSRDPHMKSSCHVGEKIFFEKIFFTEFCELKYFQQNNFFGKKFFFTVPPPGQGIVKGPFVHYKTLRTYASLTRRCSYGVNPYVHRRLPSVRKFHWRGFKHWCGFILAMVRFRLHANP